MELLPFAESSEVSLGVELEFQIIDPQSNDLISRAEAILNNIKEPYYSSKIKPELTQNMIEINSSVHHSPEPLFEELRHLYDYLLRQSAQFNIALCGGGTHPFQKTTPENILFTKEYQDFSDRYKFLADKATVFGQHIHIGCPNAEDAIYLTHALAAFIPHFIALSASSPFYQGIDTGFDSSRSSAFNSFPLGGHIPFLTNWTEFSEYIYKMQHLGIIKNIDDFFWDIRIQPIFGTIELRVCDTPLKLRKAVLIAAYLQALSLYLLQEKPLDITPELYFLYNYNRFQASRYGFEGKIIPPYNTEKISVEQDILHTIEKIKKYTKMLDNEPLIQSLVEEIKNQRNDAEVLRKVYQRRNSFDDVVMHQCKDWMSSVTGQVDTSSSLSATSFPD